MFPGSYVLYGSPRSFFTAKVENALRFLELPYRLVDKQPHDGSEVEARGGSGTLPLLRTPEDWVLWDSTPILLLLDGRFPERPILPASPVQRIAARLLEDWIDEWFTRAAMYTRWNFPESVEAMLDASAARAAFGKELSALTAGEREALARIVEGFAPFRRYMSEEVASAVASTLETGRDIPLWFEAFLRSLAEHLERHPFLLGERPCPADFALSGGFHAHFAHDPWPRRLALACAPSSLDYAERCWNATADGAGWLADDALPDGLAPFFAEMEERFLRYLAANREALAGGAEWVELDLGHGPVRLRALPYRERSRLDLRDELLRLAPDARERVRAAIPKGVLEAYLLPALAEPPVESPKGVFPGRA